MFNKILIANRGEIACRVAATARRLGVKTVAVFSDADARAAHVRACDEAVHVGGSAPAESYLQWPRIIDAALTTGAQAIHPGYGFLSENEAFAEACARAGLVFIGPPASAIAAMGSKAAAKALMEKAGVPLVPGYHGSNNDPAYLQGQADAMGYPVLIKASAGGGGKGMRRVDRSEDFAAALASCQREAKASFGDDHVLVERYVSRPRHIEIQVFADTHGHCVYVFERDCSVQRRHQKVLEEAPAPGLSEVRRAEMGAAAVAAAQAVGYVGAGTVEFIAEPTADGDLRFYFMEMNTRLQVEHPVTEAITGLDLVEWQLRVAAGQPLPLKQDQLQRHGHAIEARICAENPEGGFLPATGTLQGLRWPEHVRFERSGRLPRVDAGVGEGDAISPHYDSMIAKLIVWGEDRAQALARLEAALAATQIAGLHTNVAFLRRAVQCRAFAQADLDTALIERERDFLFAPSALTRESAVAAVALAEQALERSAVSADPWSQRDGWRLRGAASRPMAFTEGGEAFEALVLQSPAGVSLQMQPPAEEPQPLSGLVRSVQPLSHGAGWVVDVDFTVRGTGHAATVFLHGDERAVFAPAGMRVLHRLDPMAQAGQADAHGSGLKAPMPGKVTAFLAQAGQAVKAGQAVAMMEAMKMEHTLVAPRDGVIEELLYAPGDQVSEGAELVRLVKA
ncbi:MAG: acetyl/propionyl/methylcrotonyl-CoA carboxylase subunit alpha [Betaproteobacteria bacterium]|nr:acetyl/propionyl/methylcrotonyl-CoA carboxylase subunit alpha [Betaproteobacteria bacterium]